jgi:hypothetical protein
LFSYTGNLVFLCSEMKEVMMGCTCNSNGGDNYIHRTVRGKYLGKWLVSGQKDMRGRYYGKS